MIELKCNNCGSHELVLEHGVYRCRSCGSLFLADPQVPRPDPAKIEKYRDKMIDAMLDLDPDKQAKYMNKLLKLDPRDPYAWTGKVYNTIGDGLDSNAKECVTCAQLALQYARESATEEEYDDIKDFMYSHFRMYGRKMMRLVPELETVIEEIMAVVGLEMGDL